MSDSRTPELREADDNLLAALTERFRVNGVLRDDEVIEQYVVSVYINGIDLMDRNSVRYGYATRDSGEGPYAAPVHALYGLLRMAQRWVEEPDDDE